MNPLPDSAAGDPRRSARPVSRRTVLGASTAASLGVTTTILPLAAVATSVAVARSGFIQTEEFTATELGTLPGDDIERSFSHGGKQYFLDIPSWRVYEFDTALATRIITLTGVPDANWSTASNLVLEGDAAFILAANNDGDGLVAVRLDLPFASTSVAATTQAIDLSGRFGTKELSGESWTLTHDGSPFTVSGSDLLDPGVSPLTPGWPTGASKTAYNFSGVGFSPVLVHDGTNLRGLYRIPLSDPDGDPYYLVQASPRIYWTITASAAELITIPPSLSGTATFAAIHLSLDVNGASGSSIPTDPADNIPFLMRNAVHRSGELIALSSGRETELALQVPLSAPATRTRVGGITLPTGLTGFSVATGGGQIVDGDDLYLPADVDVVESGTPVTRAGVIRVDLSQAGLPVTAFGVVPGSDYAAPSLAMDGTYFYVGYYEPDAPYLYGVARLDRTTLAWDASAVVELTNSSDHYGYVSEAGASAVISAGGGTAPFTAYAFVAPS